MKHLRNFKLFEFSLPKLFKKGMIGNPKLSEKGPEGESTYVEFYYGDTFCVLTNLVRGGDYTLEVYGDGTDLEVLMEDIKEKDLDFDRVSVDDKNSSIKIVRYHRELHLRYSPYMGGQMAAHHTIVYGKIAYVMVEGLSSEEIVAHLKEVNIKSIPVEGGVKLVEPLRTMIYIPFSDYEQIKVKIK